MPAIKRKHLVDPKTDLVNRIGDDISKLTIVNPYDVLCAVYFPPEQTAGSIIMTAKHIDEAKYQGIVGLIMKMGDLAFIDDEEQTYPVKPKLGDWIIVRRGDDFRVDLTGERR